MLIVLEGLDGAGKSTQLKMLCDYLQERGDKLRYLHFPRYDAPVYGELISNFLKGEYGGNDAVHPQLVALLFAEDRRAAAEQIRQWLSDGCCVVLDRYVYSNIAFQTSKLADREKALKLREWIFNLEYNIFGIPKPDLNLFLDVPIGFVESRLHHQRTGSDRDYLDGAQDIHEADIEFQKKVRAVYSECCDGDESFIRIDCADPETGQILPPEPIFEKIKSKL
ncbi:MAG: dTMP kinase [Bacteroidales bacterium]|nr:dTMP kinase [Bacteroidales bacterium]